MLLGISQTLFLRWPSLPALYRGMWLVGISACAFMAVSFGSFVRYHVMLVRRNFTTLEELFHMTMDFQEENKFDCGLRMNLEQVFGRYLLLAWLPLDLPPLRPVGDGTFFPTQKLVEFEPLLPGIETTAHGKTAASSKLRRNVALQTWAEWVGGASWDVADDDNDFLRRDSLLAELFDLHDLDCSGAIAKEELRHVTEKLASAKENETVEGQPLLAPKAISKVFNEIDSKMDGQIDREEFCSYYTTYLKKVHSDPRGQLYILERLVNEVRAARGMEPLQALRRKPELAYVKGEEIKLWSRTAKGWVSARVVEAFDHECYVGGYAVKAGSYKVSTGTTMKWIA
eukprot:CAMPEP_0117590554 /NCGR_PEP_ID=MMETSP0784-20121206/71040_1 /TAXON_ID=39447 /ORGANISM="" /LENGTH=341 /DNA_ID=CAMNT_0005392175 /DNA_START=134 /DNA_END=1155 /DNA_ORIENTATION=-